MNRLEQWAYTRRRRAAIAAGTWRPPVDPTPAIEHIRTLRSKGMSVAAIAAAAGLPHSTIMPLAWPENSIRARTTISTHTADAILAATTERAPGWAWMPNVGARRRVEALQCMGWPLSELGRRLGVSAQAVSRMKFQEHVSVDRAERIANLYDRLCMTPGPDRRTRTWAAKAGHVPPLAWDDIDDPTEVPQIGGVDDYIDEIAVERAIDGRRVTLTLAERIEVVRRLTAQGWSDAQVAEALGLTERTVTRDRVKHGIESMWRAAA